MPRASHSAKEAATTVAAVAQEEEILVCFGDLTMDDEDGGINAEDKKVKNPSKDIRGDLQNIIENELDFSGSFSFHKSWAEREFPNPLLSINGFGSVGLPLGVRDALAIKEHAAQAPFGKADKTIVDKTVRDTWEIDGSKIHFRSAAWKPFMDTLVRNICETLGVNFHASRPRCELYKLLLYEKGSHVLPGLEGLELAPSQLEGFLLQLGPRKVDRDAPAQEVVQHLELVSTEHPHYSSYLSTQSTKAFLVALEFCLTHTYPDAGAHIIQRLTQPTPTTKLTENYVERTLAPLIPEVHELLCKYKLSPSAPPYAALFRASALHYAQTVLGPRPRDPAPQIAALARWTCTCAHCSTVRRFLASQNANQSSMRLERIGAPNSSFGQVSKGPLLVQHEEWKAKQQQGTRILAQISAESTQLKATLGEDYLRITTLMRGDPAPASTPTSGPSKSMDSNTNTTRTPALGVQKPVPTNGPRAQPAAASAASSKASLVRKAPPTGDTAPPAKRSKASHCAPAGG
ncbi:uncharacterized protein BXZ73DRAFT_80729 [Epithele typhae]|uniref:uncharacterized protein n=1 Tax=Epithele typhae TaxID=378194 RepID=UPI0020078BC7|nr:uncharacterized protein BXZ73DRAFT_80729 [Epithele typhae]KAH9917888.1 hypothetical protein BXZ73DRAFT_80729 [Epithele typhae]